MDLYLYVVELSILAGFETDKDFRGISKTRNDDWAIPESVRWASISK